MNESQKMAIVEMRNQKWSYAKIAEALTLSINTVKSYCQRNSLDNKLNGCRPLCKQCSRIIDRKGKCKPRQFCSDKCRYAWGERLSGGIVPFLIDIKIPHFLLLDFILSINSGRLAYRDGKIKFRFKNGNEIEVEA